MRTYENLAIHGDRYAQKPASAGFFMSAAAKNKKIPRSRGINNSV